MTTNLTPSRHLAHAVSLLAMESRRRPPRRTRPRPSMTSPTSGRPPSRLPPWMATLPASRDCASRDDSAPYCTVTVSAAGESEHRHAVLLVEDDYDTREAFTAILESLGVG